MLPSDIAQDEPLVLLYPAKEKLDLPAFAIDRRDGRGGQLEVVREERKQQVGSCIVKADTPRFAGIALCGMEAAQPNHPITLQSGSSIDGTCRTTALSACSDLVGERPD